MLHGLHGLRIGRAAAPFARQVVANFFVVRIWMGIDVLGRHQNDGRSVTALEGACLDEGHLYRAERSVARQMLDSLDFGAEGREIQASGDCAAVDQQLHWSSHSLLQPQASGGMILAEMMSGGTPEP
jgi:hypothetical protein